MSVAAPESILKYFPEAQDNETVIKKLIGLTSSFAQSTDDLFAKWEVFAIQQRAVTYVNEATIDSFQAFLEQSQRANLAKRQRLTPKMAPRTRLSKIKTELPLSSPRRADAPRMYAQVLRSIQAEAVKSSGAARVGLTLNTDLADFTYRPFNSRLSDASKELDDEIEKIIEVVLAAYKLERSDLVNPEQISQGLGVAVGRICREPLPIKQTSEASKQWATRLTPNSMQLETSRRIGVGARASLDFRMVEQRAANLFEGQIIAVRGKNPQGDQFIVHEILDLPRLPVARVTAAPDADKEHPTRIAVACGPGRPEKLEQFVSWLLVNPMSAVIIMGPLLDEQVGTESNKARILSSLNSLRSSLGVPVIIVPSADDAFSIDSVFPQPPITLSIDKPVVPVSNPCTFSLNDVAVTAAAMSTLRDIGQPLTSAFQHILRQRRIYPVYPQPPGVSLDVPHLDVARLGKVAPNVLLCPAANAQVSDAAIVDDVVCIAPGTLAHDLAVLISVEPSAGTLATRTRVDLMRLAEEA